MRAATDSIESFRDALAERPGDPSPLACPACGDGVDPHSQHVVIADSVVRLFCSEHCLADTTNPKLEIAAPPRRWVTRIARVCGNVFLIGAGLASLSPARSTLGTLQVAWAAHTSVPYVATDAPTNSNEQPLYGPAPPTDEDVALQFALALGNDKWVHPLPGPVRRMPNRDSRVFGADRPGDRPHECRSGHCGVDIGGDVWGEHVYAVHDGLIERIERRPKPNGGKYVRIAHRDGTVISQYFHLAAIPRSLRPGSAVKAGDIIGVVGETGVERSGPHLHFSVSVRPEGSSREIYIDPEPLVALWPLKVVERSGARTVLAPGVPRGATGAKRTRRRARRVKAAAVTPTVEALPAPEPVPAPAPEPAPTEPD